MFGGRDWVGSWKAAVPSHSSIHNNCVATQTLVVVDHTIMVSSECSELDTY